MLGNLISAIMLSTAIGIGGPLNTSTDYQDVNVTETYEYETNEVNSVDDLVVGNIYHLEFTDFDTNLNSVNYILKIGNSYNYELTSTGTIINYNSTSYKQVSLQDNQLYYVSGINYVDTYNYVGVYTGGTINFSLDFIYVGFTGQTAAASYFLPYISASDYLGEKTVTVTPIEYDGMFAIFTNFLYSRLFSGDVLTSMETTILGQTLTLGQWVSSSVAIVILCLIVFMLVKFVIWLFKLVGGAFLWK